MTLRIAGIGTAVPKYSISQADASEVSKWFCHAADEQLLLIEERLGSDGNGHCLQLQHRCAHDES